MKLHTIIGLFICSGLLLTGGAGVIVGYYYNSQKQTMTTEDGEVVEKDIYLNMLPGQKKDFNIEVDFDWYSNADTSLWFTDVDEYSAKYISVSARQGEQLLFLNEDGTHKTELFIKDGIHLTHEARIMWANDYIKPTLKTIIENNNIQGVTR